MGKHWITLHADSFLWLKGNMGLVYNAENKKSLLFTLSGRVEEICHQLLKTENLYTAELTDDDLNNNEISEWIHSLVDIQAGFLSHNIAFDKRPVSLKPILKVQNKKEYYELHHTKGHGGEILQNLHELTFYINGSKYGSNEYFKQHIFPLKDNQHILDSSKILSFIGNSRNPLLTNINLVGDLFSYPDFEQFISSISDFSVQCTIHITIQDVLDNLPKIKEINWSSRIQFNILVDAIFDVSFIQDIPCPFSITAFVFSEEEYTQLSDMFETLSLDENQSIRYIPLYNKENLDFFESNVFVEKDELEHIGLSKDEIFMRQALNINDFGKLTILSDGMVYANVNEPPLGSIDNTPYSIVYKEFTEGKSWFKVRDKMPCCDCVYQWLCPSPSNYEIVIGKPNLCHIRS